MLAEYFITFPLAIEPELYGSLYLNCSFDGLLEAQNNGFNTDDRIVILVHGPLARTSHAAHESSISPHPLVLGPEAPDLVDDGAGIVVTSDHKIGGRPYCIQEPELTGADALFARGFIQVLQLDFPSAQDGSVKGSWPFGGGLFNVFWKPPFTGIPFYWCQQA